MFSRTKAAEYSQCAFREEFTVHLVEHNIPEASEIYAVCTSYAADLIIKQLELARTISGYEVSLSVQGAVVTFKDKKYDITLLENGCCSCVFSKTLLMPCRHVIFLPNFKLALKHLTILLLLKGGSSPTTKYT